MSHFYPRAKAALIAHYEIRETVRTMRSVERELRNHVSRDMRMIHALARFALVTITNARFALQMAAG